MKKSKKLKFAMKSLTFSCLICALNLYFAQKLVRRAKFARGCSEETLCGSILVSDHSVFAFGWSLTGGSYCIDIGVIFFSQFLTK